MSIQNVTVLGSTGSIGKSTLDVISRHPDKFSVYALSANTRHDLMLEQCLEFRPKYAVMLDEESARILKEGIVRAGLATEVESGMAALEKIASLAEVDTVMAAIVGAAGMRPALAAAKTGKRILLANKETLVMAGGLFMDAIRENGATLLPIDSEHNAVFQVLPRDFASREAGVKRILLTASGGPFRTFSRAALEHVTPEEACRHPNWSMGRKISVDSATMMNKGLEVIEAHWLFDAPPDRIRVVVHPESIVHSMVEYIDGSILAQLGNPDMRTPIAYALGFPERIGSGVESLDLCKIAALHFEEPDFSRFPCLALAFQALEAGGAAPTILNAANEIAVQRFLEGKIRFTEIPGVISGTLDKLASLSLNTLDDALEVDEMARSIAKELVA